MCGRYTLHTERDRIRERFLIARDLARLEKLFSRYNIAPSQPVAAVRVAGEDGTRELVALRWGLIPPWAKEGRSEYSTICPCRNGRGKTHIPRGVPAPPLPDSGRWLLRVGFNAGR